MPTQLNPYTDETNIHKTTLRQTIQFLNQHPIFINVDKFPISILKNNNPQLDLSIFNNTPELMAEFLVDILKGTHKEWSIYKTIYSNTLITQTKGRPEPDRKTTGIAIHKTERLAKLYQRWNETYTPNLYLSYLKTDKERIKAILTSDCPPQIKAELLEVFK